MSTVGSSPNGVPAPQCENSKSFMSYLRPLPHSLVEGTKLLPGWISRTSGTGSRTAQPLGSAVEPHWVPALRMRGPFWEAGGAGSLCSCTEHAPGPQASSCTVASFDFPGACGDVRQVSWLLSTHLYFVVTGGYLVSHSCCEYCAWLLVLISYCSVCVYVEILEDKTMLP